MNGAAMAVLWSPSAKAVHVEPVTAFAEHNVKCLMRGIKKTAWFLVFAGPESEARNFADELQKNRNDQMQ